MKTLAEFKREIKVGSKVSIVNHIREEELLGTVAKTKTNGFVYVVADGREIHHVYEQVKNIKYENGKLLYLAYIKDGVTFPSPDFGDREIWLELELIKEEKNIHRTFTFGKLVQEYEKLLAENEKLTNGIMILKGYINEDF